MLDGPERRIQGVGDRLGGVGLCVQGRSAGETSIDSIVDEVPSAELTAQLDLVRAAKEEVRDATAATFAALQSASAALAGAAESGAASALRARRRQAGFRLSRTRRSGCTGWVVRPCHAP